MLSNAIPSVMSEGKIGDMRLQGDGYLSPIGQNSHFSINVDSSGFLKPKRESKQNRAKENHPNVMTSQSLSPPQNQYKSKVASNFKQSTNTSMNISNSKISRQPPPLYG